MQTILVVYFDLRPAEGNTRSPSKRESQGKEPMLRLGCTELVPREETVLTLPSIDRTDLRSETTVELYEPWRFYPH
jgi:hypothetical protein